MSKHHNKASTYPQHFALSEEYVLCIVGVFGFVLLLIKFSSWWTLIFFRYT